VTSEETDGFMQYREHIYRQRLATLQQACATKQIADWNELPDKLPSPLGFTGCDVERKILYCFIPKAGSSTWASFLYTDDLPDLNKQIAWRSTKHSCSQLSPPTSSSSFILATRHPLSRLVSAFTNKFVEKQNPRYLASLTKRIIHRFGGHEVTPDSFLKFVLDTKTAPDPHWKLQTHTCPVCLVDFTVQSRVEDMDPDLLYVGVKHGIEVHLDERVNPSNHTDIQFWSQVDGHTIREIEDLYQPDFLAFGYTPQEYFKSMGFAYERTATFSKIFR